MSKGNILLKPQQRTDLSYFRKQSYGRNSQINGTQKIKKLNPIKLETKSKTKETKTNTTMKVRKL